MERRGETRKISGYESEVGNENNLKVWEGKKETREKEWRGWDGEKKK